MTRPVVARPVRPTTDGLSRRDLLRGGAGAFAGAALLGSAACSSVGESASLADQTAGGRLLAAFPQDEPYVAAGMATRLPFLIADGSAAPLAAISSTVPFTVSRDGDVVVENQEIAPRGQGISRAYLPLTVTFPEPGTYDIEAVYEGARLTDRVQAFPLASIPSPVTGQPLPSLKSPTTESTLETDPLCSRVPRCPFHEQSLDEVLGRGSPVVLLVASPAYCTTLDCDAVLESLIDLSAGRDDIAVVHCETYRNPKDYDDPEDVSPSAVSAAYELSFDPVLYITDASGLITARADAIIDSSEMAELLPPAG